MWQQYIVCSAPISIFNTILFDYLRSYHQILPDPEIKQAIMVLIKNIPYNDLPCLNINIINKPLSRQIYDKDSGAIYSELVQTLGCILENQDTELSMNEKEFQW